MKANLLMMAPLLALVVGCPAQNGPHTTVHATGGDPQPTTIEPAPSAAAVEPPVPAPVAATGGDWSVHVTSEPAGINPDLLETPEQKAKVMFDHLASSTSGKISVHHKTLDTTSAVDADAASALDTHMGGVDWNAVMAAAQKDGATEGGTTFRFAIVVGDASWEIVTTNIDRHPDLMRIVDAVKAATGKP